MNLPGFSRDPRLQQTDAYAAEFRELQQEDSQRLTLYRQHREDFESTRRNAGAATHNDLDYGRGPATQATIERHRISLPFGKALTVKHAFRIAGRLPDIVVDRRDHGRLELHRSQTIEKICWGIIRESDGEQEFSTAAWHGSQLGSSVLEVRWSIAKQMPLFRAVDPAGVFVVPGVDDPHDFQRVYRSWQVSRRSLEAQYGDFVFEDGKSFLDQIPKSSESTGGRQLLTLIERCDRHSCCRFVYCGDQGSYPVWEWQHDYGFVPAVVIPNLGPESEVWGISDYEFVRELVNYLGILMSREADIIRATAGGAYQENGTGQSAAAVKEIIRKGGVLSSKRDGEVKPIPGPEPPDFLPYHADRTMQFIKYLGFAPDAAWGDGAAGSGSDRGLQLQPLLELTALKQINWSGALTRLFSICFRMTEHEQIRDAVYRGATVQGGYRRSPFSIVIGPGLGDRIEDVTDPEDPDFELFLPRSPSELFQGDYKVRFNWQNRIDPDDPAFVTTEVNKFVQGIQSLQTTLERLGHEAPEEEMKLIEAEAERFPWLRNGMIALLKAQLQASGQGEGGGPPVDNGGGIPDALSMMLGGTSALDADAAIAGLPGDTGTGILYGGA